MTLLITWKDGQGTAAADDLFLHFAALPAGLVQHVDRVPHDQGPAPIPLAAQSLPITEVGAEPTHPIGTYYTYAARRTSSRRDVLRYEGALPGEAGRPTRLLYTLHGLFQDGRFVPPVIRTTRQVFLPVVCWGRHYVVRARYRRPMSAASAQERLIVLAFPGDLVAGAHGHVVHTCARMPNAKETR